MRQKGFSLIEMLVVCAIFSIVVGAITGIFISAIRAQRYSLASQQLIDQASYTMEYMSRFLRMAKKDDDAGTCTGVPRSNYWTDGTRLKFKNYKLPPEPQCQEFFLVETSADGNKQLYQELDGVELPLTSNKFNVKTLKFVVSGDNLGDNTQPKVTIFLEMEGTGASPQPRIKIQTTISQRDIDISE